MGCVSFLRAPLRPVHGHYAGERSQVATTKTDQNVSAVRCLLVHLLMSALGETRTKPIGRRMAEMWSTPDVPYRRMARVVGQIDRFTFRNQFALSSGSA